MARKRLALLSASFLLTSAAAPLVSAAVVPEAKLAPTAFYTGTAGSGFNGAPPTDPTRTSGKPFLRPLFVERQVITGDFLAVFDAQAQSGISKVRIYAEGNYIDVTNPSWVPYTDVNGTPRLMYGYAAKLSKAAFDAVTANGAFNVYAEAFPNDLTIQRRVMGPYTLYNRTSAFAGTRTVAPSGADHTSIVAALNWITTNSPSARNYRIQITANGDYPLNTAVTSTYNTAPHWVTIEAAPGVTASITGGATRDGIRPKYDGLRFKGSGIVLDHAKFSSITMENTGSGLLWLDGVTVTQTGGRSAVFDGLFPITYWTAMSSGTARRFYATDCVATGGVYNGFSYFELVRNCSLTECSGDAFQNNKCIHGAYVAAVTPLGVGGLRTHLAAVDVVYSGAGVPKIAISGAPNVAVGAGTRTLQLYVDGAAVGAALTITNPVYLATGSAHTKWADVVAHINGVANFSATVNGAAGTRRASSASKAGLGPTETLANGTGREITFSGGAAQITAIFDVHTDVSQYFGSATVPQLENMGGRFMSCKALSGQGFYVDKTTTSLADCWWSGIEIATDGTSGASLSQVFSVWSHSGVRNSTFYDQDFAMRADAAGVEKFAPDAYCSFTNISANNMSWYGTRDTDLILDRINVRAGSIPAGATNSTQATTNLYVNAPSDLTPVSGGNLLVAGTYIGARAADGTWNV